MAIQQVNDGTKFLQWKEITNELIIDLGDKVSLTTTDKSDLVSAVNEVDGDVGDISALTTTEKGSIVGSINELDTDIGDPSALTTTLKTSLVVAVNEVDGEIGDISTLTTTNTTNLVNAINSVETEGGDLTTLTTTEKGSLVGAVNELDGEIGDISTLTTTDKTDIVSSINEVDAKFIPDVYFPNLDNGRFATETAIVATTFDTGMFAVYNTSTLTEGHKFIDDNLNNGGAGGTMSVDASDLTTFLGTKGRTDLINGWEWFVMDLAGGAGTANSILENGTTYYPFIENGSIYLGAVGDVLTWSGYVKTYDATNALLLGNTDITTYIDGVEQANPYEMTDADNWVHVVQTITLTKEYYNLFPAISGLSTANARIALSCLYRSENLNPHLGVVI